MWIVSKSQKAMLRSYCADAARQDKGSISVEVDCGNGRPLISWLDFSIVDTYDGAAELTLNVYQSDNFICAIDVTYRNHGEYTTLSMSGGISDEEHKE